MPTYDYDTRFEFEYRNTNWQVRYHTKNVSITQKYSKEPQLACLHVGLESNNFTYGTIIHEDNLASFEKHEQLYNEPSRYECFVCGTANVFSTKVVALSNHNRDELHDEMQTQLKLYIDRKCEYIKTVFKSEHE